MSIYTKCWIVLNITEKTTTLNQFYGIAANRFLKKMSEINFNQYALTGILNTCTSIVERIIHRPRCNPICLYFLLIWDLEHSVEINLNVLLKAFSNHFSVIFLEDCNTVGMVIANLIYPYKET